MREVGSLVLFVVALLAAMAAAVYLLYPERPQPAPPDAPKETPKPVEDKPRFYGVDRTSFFDPSK